jgi:hypothetical protein
MMRAYLTNLHVLMWLLTGASIGALMIWQQHFSVVALLTSLLFPIALLTLFGRIRRQQLR